MRQGVFESGEKSIRKALDISSYQKIIYMEVDNQYSIVSYIKTWIAVGFAKPLVFDPSAEHVIPVPRGLLESVEGFFKSEILGLSIAAGWSFDEDPFVKFRV